MPTSAARAGPRTTRGGYGFCRDERGDGDERKSPERKSPDRKSPDLASNPACRAPGGGGTCQSAGMGEANAAGKALSGESGGVLVGVLGSALVGPLVVGPLVVGPLGGTTTGPGAEAAAAGAKAAPCRGRLSARPPLPALGLAVSTPKAPASFLRCGRRREGRASARRVARWSAACILERICSAHQKVPAVPPRATMASTTVKRDETGALIGADPPAAPHAGNGSRSEHDAAFSADLPEWTILKRRTILVAHYRLDT